MHATVRRYEGVDASRTDALPNPPTITLGEVKSRSARRTKPVGRKPAA
jgi:hypothetical protein